MGAESVTAPYKTAGNKKASHLHADIEYHAEDEHVVTAFAAGKGTSRCRIGFRWWRAGFRASFGAASRRYQQAPDGGKLRFNREILTIDACAKPGSEALLSVRSPWKVTSATGAQVVSRTEISTVSPCGRLLPRCLSRPTAT